MSLVKEIYDTLPSSVYYNDQYGEVVVAIKFHGKKYMGEAKLHPEDAAFFSERVGRAIATSRARIEVFKGEKLKVRNELKAKNQFYHEALGNGKKEPAEVDPTGAFKQNIEHTRKRLDSLNRAIENEKAYLRNYLSGHERAIDSVRRFRNKEQTGNNN